jgi:chromatin segregation and condensation protein Rec8/ScpA/Scc1 (kleisin family)
VYEGPFDMLLQLILREQVDIYEVNLSNIVDAYLPRSSGCSSSTSTWRPDSC